MVHVEVISWQWDIKLCEFHNCIELFTSSAMDKHFLLGLLCLQVFLLIAAFTSTDAAALLADDNQQQESDLVRRNSFPSDERPLDNVCFSFILSFWRVKHLSCLVCPGFKILYKIITSSSINSLILD